MTEVQETPLDSPEENKGGPGQAFSHFIKMEEVLHRLKILNYDIEFVKDLKTKSLHRHYFAIQTNPGEQFYLFSSLCSWLIRKCGKSFEQPQEYDDPNFIITSILDFLRGLNIPVNFAPTRLKQGYGESAIFVLDHLTNEAMKFNNIKLQKPEPVKEVEEEGDEELADEAELILEKVEEEMANFFSDNEEESVLNLEDLRNVQLLNLQNHSQKPEEVLHSTANAEEWLIELERVLPQLKMTIKTDSRDWRYHLEQLQIYNNAIKENFPITASLLNKLHDDINNTMEKISIREKHLNNHLESYLDEFRTKQDELKKLIEQNKNLNERILERSKVLTKITDDLELVKKEMEERGSNMTDGTPLINIKKAISKVKSEIVDLDVKIGVFENEILQEKLKDKTLCQQDVEQ